MRRSLFSAVASVFAGKIGSVLLSVLITPVLVRLLGSSSYGDYAFVLSVLSVTMVVVNFGLKDGIRKFIAEKWQSKDYNSQIFWVYSKFAVLTVVPTVGTVFILDKMNIIEWLIGETLSEYVFVFCLLIVLRQLHAVGRNTLMGLGQERISEPLNVIKRAVSGVVAISLVVLGYGATGALIGMAIGIASVTLVMFLVLSENINWYAAIRDTSDSHSINEFLSYNSLTVVLILLSTTLYHVDVILIRLFIGDSSAGVYKGALVIAEFLWFVPMALQTILVHETSELWSQNRTQEVTKLASRIFRYTALLTLLPLIGLMALADAFVPFYFGSEFSQAVLPLLLLLPGVFALAMARPIYAIGQGKGDLRPLITATGAASLLNLVLNLLLIPRYGIPGAAVATSIGYGSMLIFHLSVTRAIGFTPLQDPRCIKILFTGIFSTIVIFGVNFALSVDILRLLIVPPIGAVSFMIAAFFTGAIDKEEWKYITTQLSNFLDELGVRNT